MRLSEAIELGSTLIGETKHLFYNREDCEGCALGAAWVALGKEGHSFDGVELADAFPICNLYLTEQERNILGSPPYVDLRIAVSGLHFDGTSRLELARRIRLIEDLHPEIPGYELRGEAPRRAAAAPRRAPRRTAPKETKCHSNSKTSTTYAVVS